MPNLIVSAVTKYDGKGLAKGKKDIKSFDKSVKTLAKSLLGLYSATKLAQFGKSSVKAFLADDKAAKSLSRTLDNLGLGFKSQGVENYLNALQKQSGVLDDYLRPAYQGLLTVLGSTTLAQDALNVALDVAAGTGQDVTAISKTLSKAYAGNTTALGKLIPGLNKSVLASKDLEQINAELARLFGGQAATAAAGYAGQMNFLNVAASKASETIGKSLVDALILASGSTGMEGLGKKIDSAAGKISKFIDEIGIFIAYTKMAFSGASLRDLEAYAQALRGMNSPAINIPLKPAQARAQLAAEKKALELAKKNATLAKKSGIDALALKKAGTTFDLAQIQIQAALKYGIDNETRLRLLLQKALLDEDVAAAAKLQMALLANEAKTKELANLLATLPKADDPFADWPGIIAKINGLLKDLKIPGSATALLGLQGLTYNANTGTVTQTPTMATPIVVPTVVPTAPSQPIPVVLTVPTVVPTAPSQPIPVVLTESTVPSNVIPISPSTVTPTPLFTGSERDFMDTITAIEQASAAMVEYQNFRAGERGDIYVTVNTSVVGSEQALADAIQSTLQDLNRYGTSINYAGNIAI